ncbi:LysR substrate-binding domain-containing protein [Modicisalibacter radicis]|uniref:LysR substrate-binding domain-containing protein n=1 Tax=Halomonas sp. EAR18 TaxID=2518972 RepID=UPI00109C4CED|nr:LysR substrate-binding domain-containing protein [Halomonas sp. EAR18]
MKRRLPPLSSLPAFEAAGRLGNFTRAAEELHVTHGAVSRAIAQLENRLGVELFKRHARRVSLTPAGQHLFRATGTAFLALEASLEKLHEQDEAIPALRLSCEPTLAMRWLMPRLGRLRRERPELKVELHTAGGPIDLHDAECDLAIRRLDFPRPGDLRTATLCPEYAGPVCHPKCWNGVLEQDLFKARWLHSRTRPQAWAVWCRASNTAYQPAGEQHFDHFYFTLQAALDQLGTAIGPLPLVYDDLQENRLIAPCGMQATGVEYVVMSRESREEDARIPHFVSWLQQQAAPLWRLH